MAHLSETFLFLELEDAPRFAVVTHPTAPESGIGVLLCNGGWISGSWYFNRFYVKLARSLASAGHLVVRFDWFGSGESPGFLRSFRLDEPFIEDVVAAATQLGSCRAIVGVGYCFGATSLLAAANRIERLAGAVLVSAVVPGSGPRARATKATVRTLMRSAVRLSVIKGWFNPNARRLYLKWFRVRIRAFFQRFRQPAPNVESRVSMAKRLESLTDRGALVKLIYGENDSNLRTLSLEPFATLAESGKLLIEVLPGDVEGSGSLEIQESISRAIEDAVAAVTRSYAS